MSESPSEPVDGAEHRWWRGDLDRHQYRIGFVAVVAVSAVLRAVYVLGAKRGDEALGDQIHYFAQAATVADGRWFEDPWNPGAYSALHPPLTALALSPVSWVDDHLILTQRLTMALYGAVVVAGVGLLARLLFDRWTSLASMGVAGLYANLWMNDGLIMSETFAAAGVVAVLLAAYRFDERDDLLTAAVMGAAVGLAGLARGELLLLGVFVALPLCLRPSGTPWGRRALHLAIAGVAAVAVISPWVVRNQVRFDESTFISTQDGLTLLGSNCDDVYYGPGIGFWAIRCADETSVPDGADESVRSRIYREEAFDYVADHAGRVPVVVLARLGRGLSIWENGRMTEFNQSEGRESWASWIDIVQYWMLVPVAAYGWWRWPSERIRWPLAATAAVAVFVIVSLYGLPRFRISAEIPLVLCASAGTVELVRRLPTSR